MNKHNIQHAKEKTKNFREKERIRNKKIGQIFFIYRIRERDFKSTEDKLQHDVVDLSYKMF
jgi:hypothetical protein